MELDRYKSESRMSYELLVPAGTQPSELTDEKVMRIVATFGTLRNIGRITSLEVDVPNLSSTEVESSINQFGACLLRSQKWGPVHVVSPDEPFKSPGNRQPAPERNGPTQKRSTQAERNAFFRDSIRSWNEQVSTWFADREEVNATGIRKFYEARAGLLLDLNNKMPNPKGGITEEAEDESGEPLRPSPLILRNKKVSATTIVGMRVADLQLIDCEITSLRFDDCKIIRLKIEGCKVGRLDLVDCSNQGQFEVLNCQVEKGLLVHNTTAASGVTWRKLSVGGDLNVRKCVFEEQLEIANSQFLANASFPRTQFKGSVRVRHCNFKGTLNLQGSEFASATDFVYCQFLQSPFFFNCVLPSDLSFFRTTFKSVYRVEDLHAFRALRAHFSARKDARQEGRFFELEQRVDRRLIPTVANLLVAHALVLLRLAPRERLDHYRSQAWSPTLGNGFIGWLRAYPLRLVSLEGIISGLYDFSSRYGQSLARPLFLLFFSIPAFSYLYYLTGSAATTSKSQNILSTIPAPIGFALQNLLNPTAVVSEKAIVVATSPIGFGLAVIQVFVVLVTLSLFVVAIRRRFLKSTSE